MLFLLFNKTYRQHQIFHFSPASIFLLFIIFCLAFSACRTVQKTDMRSLAPRDAIAYLEINDLSVMLNTLTDTKVFQENSTNKPDFSTFENVQAAVVITGFETSEKQINEENSVLNFKPKFVAIADSHAWKTTAVSIVENQIGKFAKESYGEDVKLEKSEKRDAKFFVWTNREESKFFAAVSHSVIYVGNDEALLDKCLAVERGEAESLLKNENLAQASERANAENLLAFGYVSPESIKQFADIAGVSVALKSTESDESKSLIAQVLPNILKNTTKELVWTARKAENKIEDNFFVSLNDEAVSIFQETLKTSAQTSTDTAEFLPSDVYSATNYNLQNPLVAWRSLLLVTAKNTDALSGKFLIQFSDSLLEPYGISNAEMFLSAIDSEIFTAQFDAEGANSIAIVTVKDVGKVKKSMAEINFKSPPEKQENAEIWKSEDKELSAAFVESKLILGSSESVLKCLHAKPSGQNFTKNQNYQKFGFSKSTALTFGRDSYSVEKIIALLGNAKEKNQKISTDYITETRFTGKGIERKTISDFGFLGTILEQLGE